MAHSRGQAPAAYDRAFVIGIALNVTIVVVETAAGILAGSLALVADASHNLIDVLALGLAWGAAALSRRQPTLHRTYGLRRSSILAALANALGLLVVTGAIGGEAIRRLGDANPVSGSTLIWVAALAAIGNACSALLFLPGQRRDVNLRGAFLHLASDAAVSMGVVIAGFAILATGWFWIDSAITLLIGLVILASSWGVLRESLNLALDAVPDNIDPLAVRTYLIGVPGVVDVHDLHIWGMSTTETALTAHLVTDGPGLDDAMLARVGGELDELFEIHHATLQVEHGDPDYPCGLTAHAV